MARPREFDPDDALDKAMHQFWAKGYHDTSIRDLVTSTGVNYYGLYGVFDSKHGLFLAALDRYRDTVTAEVVEALRQSGPVQQAVERALETVLANMQTPRGRVGCLMCNTATEVAPDDEAAAEKVRAHRALLKKAFRARLSDGKAAGEIGEPADVKALSEFLATTVYVIGLLVRSGQDDSEVRRYIRTALTTLG